MSFLDSGPGLSAGTAVDPDFVFSLKSDNLHVQRKFQEEDQTPEPNRFGLWKCQFVTASFPKFYQFLVLFDCSKNSQRFLV